MTDRETIDDLTRLIGDMRKAQSDSATEIKSLRAALKRAVPWLGKLIADGGHMDSVAPNDAIGALEQAEAALASKTPAVPAPKIVIQIQGGCLVEVCIGIPADVYLFDWDNIEGENIEWTSKRLAEWPDSFRLATTSDINPDQVLLEVLRDLKEVDERNQQFISEAKMFSEPKEGE